ncbi:ABC transporter ATP-binding protein [Anaerolentibacter hominis]|uniref:ABC transporter ATP-binding protein n=1 Tax=Anaerolentibacter hominis TaxID=3079009 RepID=UPI0031B8AA5D
MEKHFLTVSDLTIQVPRRQDGRSVLETVVNGISFCVHEGEVVGLVGESGSGKSITALAVMNLNSEETILSSGSIVLNGMDLLKVKKDELRSIRGSEMAMIFQEPMTSLNPVLTVGRQLEEMLLLHKNISRRECYEEVIKRMGEVGLKHPETIYRQYPHNLSGGMRQRVMIAMAMLLKPRLLIADEPTTALDITIQAQIISLLKHLNETYHTAILFISHDLGVVKSLCSRVLVMCDGDIVEEGLTDKVLYAPEHAYTKRLLAAVPTLKTRLRDDSERGSGTEPSYICRAENVAVSFEKPRRGLFQKKERKKVLKGISMAVKCGEILGIVGESGCGKTTLARTIAGLLKPEEGTISLEEKPGLVFQDPYASLNPAKKVGWILEEPLRVAGTYSREERKRRVREMIGQIGMKEEYLDSYISELSGGQRQRVAIGCALMEQTKFLILDEPVSALDVTIQAQILELLAELQEKQGLTYLFISHDLNVVYQLCDRVLVMHRGNVIEAGPVQEVYDNPREEYTKELIRAIPEI